MDSIPKEQRFFDLPIGTKTTCAHKGGPIPVRGYNGYSQEKSWKLSPGNEKLTDAKDARVCPDGKSWTVPSQCQHFQL